MRLLRLLALVTMVALLLPLRSSGDAKDRVEGVTPTVVFVGWLEHATTVQILLPNGNFVTYSGEKLKQIVKELQRCEGERHKK